MGSEHCLLGVSCYGASSCALSLCYLQAAPKGKGKGKAAEKAAEKADDEEAEEAAEGADEETAAKSEPAKKAGSRCATA